MISQETPIARTVVSEKQIIRVGHSPDPDDAFMFHALANGKIVTGRYEFQHELVDIETLNRRALHGELELTAEGAGEAGGYQMHPMLIDGCLQLLTPLLAREEDSLFLPVGVTRLALHRSVGPRCRCHAVLTASGRASKRADLWIFHEDGQLAVELEGFQFQRVARNVLEGPGEKWLAENAFEHRRGFHRRRSGAEGGIAEMDLDPGAARSR